MKRTVRREGDVEMCARKALSSCWVGAATEYRIVICGARSIELHPLERCALCATSIRSSHWRFAAPNSADNSAVDSTRVMWLPPLSVCSGCSVRTFQLWRTFHFSIDGERIRAIEAPAASARAIFGQGAHESAWLANARVVETLALSLAARAVPHEGTFASSLAATMCDLKLLRVVAERMLPPPSRVVARRALSCYIGSAY